MLDYSFVGSIYSKTKPTELYSSLYSISQQTLPCTSIILYLDGDLSDDHHSVIKYFADLIPIDLVYSRSSVPRGLGLALKFAMKEVTSIYALRFDADDISRPNRAYKLINFLEDNPSVDVIGAQAHEFSSHNCCSLMQKRVVPCNSKAVYNFARYKNPLNHPTVAFRQSSYKNSTGYDHGLFYEDYILWLNMLKQDFNICNLVDVLVYQKTDGMYSRRSGFSLIKGEFTLLNTKLQTFTHWKPIDILHSMFVFVLRCMLRFMPSFILRTVYSAFLRSNFKF